MGAKWIDLLDPGADEVRAQAPRPIEDSALELLLDKPEHEDEPRPTLQGHGEYVFGVFLSAVVRHEQDAVFYQEVDIVATADTVLTIRKTPPGCAPLDLEQIRRAVKPDDSAGMILYRLVDDIAERYLDLIDDLDEEIDELEDAADVEDPERTRARISKLRHDLLHIRRTLSPMRDAIRRVVDDVVEVAPPHLHSRALRSELLAPLPGDPLAVRIRLVVGADHRHDRGPTLVFPAQALDLAARERFGRRLAAAVP
jgi:magnesium transporter